MAGEPTGPIAGGARLIVVCDGAAQITPLFDGSEIEAKACSADRALETVARGRVDAAIIGSADLLAELRRHAPDLPLLWLATLPPPDAAVTLVPAPVERGTLIHAVRSALVLSYSADAAIERALLGQSRAMKRVRDLIGRAAPGLATILVRGETGTGKELVARAIHQASDRAAGPLVTIHCAALPDTLLESELFGYEKGAFTGAAQQRQGRVELAAGGTLFLDEIGDISGAVQVKLLRLLQDREFQRLGSNDTLSADVRFVAATHRDLEAMVKAGEFREDLFYRLNVVPLWVPPLRARRDDVVLLAQHFCAQHANTNRRRVALDASALDAIKARQWPGNVRQLANFIERLVVLAPSETIGAEDVARELSDASPFTTHAPESTTTSISVQRRVEVVRLDEAVARAEREAIAAALVAAKNNRSKAARLLGISRASLYNKLKEHDLP